MIATAGAQVWSEQIERWPEHRLRAWQASRLSDVVAHAYQVPFYRELWNGAGLANPQVKSIEDLKCFPIVRKQDLVRARDKWSTASDGPVGFSTRGTSGEPLMLWLSAREEESYIQPTMRGFRWAGFQPGMTALLMSPVWHRLAACEAHAIVRLGGRCAFFWGSLGPDHTASFVTTLDSIRPRFVTTTAPFIQGLVRRAQEEGLDLPRLFASVHSIVAVGLPLTPRTREYLRDHLGVDDVFERGGTQEGAALDECRLHNTPHLHEDVCYAEVLGPDDRPLPAGERGRLVVTKLTTAGSVFVRYDTGDIAAFNPGSCACGCTFRRLKIVGRPESSVMVNGRAITAYDVRLAIEHDSALVGRNVLLIRGPSAKAGALSIAIEGDECNESETRRRLQDLLAVGEVNLRWLGGLRVNWGFRQVIDGREIGIENR